MGNTAQSARFRGIVQLLAERHLDDVNEVELVRNEFWDLKLDSIEDFYTKFSAQDARDMLETGNAYFLLEGSLERLTEGKTACRALSRLIPCFFANQMSLPSAPLFGLTIVSALCEDKICFDEEKDEDERDVLWAEFDDKAEPGKVKDSNAHDENRVEVLRLLVVALSEPLFSKGVSPGEVHQYVFDGIVDATFKEESISERATNLFVSMFAVLCEHSEQRKTSREELAQHCCDALASLLDLPVNTSNPLLYVFRNLQQKHREQIFAAIAQRIEHEQCTSISSLCLLWRLLDSGSSNIEASTSTSIFSSVSSDTLCSLIFSFSKALFSYRREGKTRHSTVQLVSIILFCVSCDRKTGLAVNRTLSAYHRKRLPQGFFITSSEWTYADVLICAVNKFVVDGEAQLFEPLQRLVLTALVNFSWYLKCISATPCQLLVAMFERVSKRRFLLAKETNHLYVKSLLEIFTNILQYQSQGNAKLIYAMLRSRHAFFDLFDLPFAVASGAEEPKVAEGEDQAQRPEPSKEESAGEPTNQESSKVKQEEIQSLLPKPFVPTKEWFDDWRSKLQLSVPIFAMKELAPKVDGMVSSREEDYLQIIEDTTLVGALPPPPPIIISKYARTDKIDEVIRRCFWMSLFRSEDYLDLWRVPPPRSNRGRPRRESSV